MFRCVYCDEMVAAEDQIRPGDGSWRHGDCPGMGVYLSLSKIRADFDAADEALDELKENLTETTDQLKKRLKELEEELDI